MNQLDKSGAWEEPVIYLFPSLVTTKWQRTTWAAVYETIQGDSLASNTDRYRQLTMFVADGHESAGPESESEKLAAEIKQRRMPSIITMVELKGQGRKSTDQGAYTGIIMVDIDDLNADEVETARTKVNADPHTLLSHVTISGRGVRVFARVATIPADKDEFQRCWQFVNHYYAAVSGFKVDELCKNANRMSVLCHDPQAIYRPDAQPFAEISEAQIAAMQGEGAAEANGAVAEGDQGTRYHSTSQLAGGTVRAYVELKGKVYGPGTHHDYIVSCMFLMNRLGVPVDDALQWALREFADSDKPDNNVRVITEGIYRDNVSEHGTMQLAKLKRSIKGSYKRRASTKQMRKYISKHYELRRNVFTQMVEYRAIPSSPKPVKDNAENADLSMQSEIDTLFPSETAADLSMQPENENPAGQEPECGEWKVINDIVENSIFCRMDDDGLNPDINRLRTLLQSDWVEDFNPLKDYLASLPEWDGHDHIRDWADHVHCLHTTPAEFATYFQRWLVGLLAGALDTKTVNHAILVFVGAQGIYKTSFMEHILPPQLRAYYTVKGNSMRTTKDDYFTMTEFLLINLEEIDTLSSYEIGQLKAMVTMPYVNERAAYARHKSRLEHIASFCGTGNNVQFLNDDTGSRRWLPFEVQRIDSPYDNDLPYDQIYAQALTLLRDPSYRHYFTTAECDALSQRNKRFSAPNEAEEMVLSRFRKPKRFETCLRMTASQIMATFPVNIHTMPRQVSNVMRRLGFHYEVSHHTIFWKVIMRSVEESNKFLPPEDDDDDDDDDLEAHVVVK